MVLSSQGDVYVLGDNSFSQHGMEDLPPACSRDELKQAMLDKRNNKESGRPEIFLSYHKATPIRFPTQDKIEYIACGGEHLFARTTLDEVYGWGRNDEGQVGVGYLAEKITSPVMIEALNFTALTQISCGDNYSAVVTKYGEVFVAGSLEGGKLGLGKGQKHGAQLKFRRIENLPDIDYIATGVDHMLAISRYDASNPDKWSGRTYAWGRNDHGQLGIGSTDPKYEPTPTSQGNGERFVKVACGTNFSLAMTSGKKLFFWGNMKYCGKHDQKKDLLEPT